MRHGRTTPAARRGSGSRMAGMVLLVLAATMVPGPGTAAAPRARPAAVAANPASVALRAEIARRAGSDVRSFYAARGNRPLWVAPSGAPSAALRTLLGQLESARLDGIRPGKVKASAVARALERARSGAPADVAKAELTASSAYVAYVKALRSAPRSPMIYESQALSPVVPTPAAALQVAASARALERHVATMAWMHPLYAPLRAALDDARYDPDQQRRIAANLRRVRAIPANPARRYVLVDAAAARLWMYEDGRPVDSMRVVVGKPEEETQTPAMAGFIRYAIVNPYWNVPEDLVRSRIAYNVNAKGIGYLADGGYEVLSDWGDTPRVIDPATIDWRAVEAGNRVPRVRQLPGGSNFMGRVKFMFPNAEGIYLHDTPDKALMAKDARQFSSGCVRLEDASKLGRWLMRRPLPQARATPEQRLELPELVPVYITYLTAAPERGGIAFRPDPYGRDAKGDSPRLARNDRAAANRP